MSDHDATDGQINFAKLDLRYRATTFAIEIKSN